MVVFVSIFFFQAEDGIRDPLVTGVQTCALPIWLLRPAAGTRRRSLRPERRRARRGRTADSRLRELRPLGRSLGPPESWWARARPNLLSRSCRRNQKRHGTAN